MQFQPTITWLEDDMLEDDIDRLFSQLQTLEPPPSLIVRILNQLPAHTTSATLVSQPLAWNNLDQWVIENKKRHMC